MSLNFAAISPHPPIVIPEIGSQKDLQQVALTVQALKKLANYFLEAEIDTLVVISPHMLVYPDRFNICGMKKLFGTFANFGMPDKMAEFTNNMELANKIYQKCQKENIDTILYDNQGEFFELDHGIMVPLHYLTQNQESSLKVIPITFSNLPRAAHFTFGQIIGEVAQSYSDRVGIVASGDLSHRLVQGAPAGFSKIGHDFDKKLVDNLKTKSINEILYYDEDFVEDAGECGYRSILILLGALDGLNAKPDILSYEGPFGVGYLVANYHLTT